MQHVVLTEKSRIIEKKYNYVRFVTHQARQVSDSMKVTVNSKMQWFLVTGKYATETSMNDIQPVVFLKFRFDFLDKSVLIAPSVNSDLLEIQCPEFFPAFFVSTFYEYTSVA